MARSNEAVLEACDGPDSIPKTLDVGFSLNLSPICTSAAWCWRCGVGFLCVGGPHMASVGRGSEDGKGKIERRKEKTIQRGGNPINKSE